MIVIQGVIEANDLRGIIFKDCTIIVNSSGRYGTKKSTAGITRIKYVHHRSIAAATLVRDEISMGIIRERIRFFKSFFEQAGGRNIAHTTITEVDRHCYG